jgi:hypothetical protein
MYSSTLIPMDSSFTGIEFKKKIFLIITYQRICVDANLNREKVNLVLNNQIIGYQMTCVDLNLNREKVNLVFK